MNTSVLELDSVMDRILVVDDIADNSFLLQTILEAEGYRVDVADDGMTALAQMAAYPPDLVLLDVMMPHMNGYEVAEQIRCNPDLSFIPVVLVTGNDQATIAAELKIEIDGLIRKPIDYEQLLDQVRSILQSKN
jgi:CheY-like chemotaxis protein